MPKETNMEAAGRQTCDVRSVLVPFMTTYRVFVLQNFLESHRLVTISVCNIIYRGADKSLARPGRKQATATEEFEFHISYL
jgi:hypothetical protein